MRRTRPALVPSSDFSLFAFSALILCILIFSTFSFAAADRIAGPITSGQFVKVSGVPRKAQPKSDRGRVNPSLKLNYMTLLTVPSASQQKAIDKLLAQQQDPHSSLYHKWLTPEEYAERFGLSPNDIKKLTAWLESQGFSVHTVARARNFIVFSGTAGQAENAFQTEIHNFEFKGNNRFSNATPISVPAALSGVVAGIRGLSNFPAKSYVKHRSPNYTYPVTGGYNLYLAPGDIETMYDLGPLYGEGIDGTGMTLAVMGETDVYLDDLNYFRSNFGLSTITGCTTDTTTGLIVEPCVTTNLRYVLIDSSDPLAPDSYQSGDLEEADLDLEMSGAVARNAQIIYINAPDTSGDGVWDSWYYAVDNNVAPVITLSYGNCEWDEAYFGAVNGNNIEGSFGSDESELRAASLLGITFMNSSGDSGAAACDPNNYTGDPDPYGYDATGGLAVSYPASSPEVTGVGGTMTTINEVGTDAATYWYPSNDTNGNTNGGSAITYIPEAAWNDEAEIGAYCVANPKDTACTGNLITNQETAQQAFGIGAGGGGASNCFTIDSNFNCTGGFAQPVWQQNLVITGQTTKAHVTTGVAAVRFSPDVSLLASPNFPGFVWCTAVFELADPNTAPYNTETTSSCANGINAAIAGVPTIDTSDGYPYVASSIIGGTSAASPMFAGIVTLLNQYVVQNGFQSSPGLGPINANLYQIATYNKSAFHAITASDYVAGNNTVYCDPGSPGYTSPATALNCPAAVAPLTEGIFGYYSSAADPTTGYNLVTGLGSVNANNLATAWGDLLTASTTSLSPSATSIVPGASETFTITVTPSTASGIVTLYNNGSSTPLGTPAIITAGSGTFTTTALPAGTNSIAGTYVGTNATSTSGPVVVDVVAPTFSFANTGSTSHTVLAGETSLTYTFLVTPTSGSSFAGAVTFGCVFSPTDTTLTTSSCVFNPTSIAAGTSSPTGTSVTMTLTTVGPNKGSPSQLRHRADKRSPWLPLALPLAGIVMVGLAGRRISKRSAIAGLFAMLALLGLMVACGGGTNTVTTPVSVVVSQASGQPTSLYPNDTTDDWQSQTAQFTATVSNTTNTAVTWSLSSTGASCSAESSPCGSVSSSGLYTAPTIASGLPSLVSVIATSAADTSKSASASETIKAATYPQTYGVTVAASESGNPTAQTQGVTLDVQ